MFQNYNINKIYYFIWHSNVSKCCNPAIIGDYKNYGDNSFKILFRSWTSLGSVDIFPWIYAFSRKTAIGGLPK
jgi:hypothetical protein